MNILNKLAECKQWIIRLVMWRLFYPKKWMRYYIRHEAHGSFQFDDGTWLVHQSDEFHKYCYDVAWKQFKNAT